MKIQVLGSRFQVSDAGVIQNPEEPMLNGQ